MLRIACQNLQLEESPGFVIETARAFTLVGETRWPAPQSETVIAAKPKFNPEKCQKERCPPAHFVNLVF
jgi:hypothetical protein